MSRAIKNLFNIKPARYEKKESNADTLAVSRVALVSFLTKKCGLLLGNKVQQHVDVPQWIQRHKQYRVACLRGLIDTDGCIFTHRYIVKGKVYAYKKFSFTSASEPLLRFVYAICKELGLHPRMSRNGRNVRLDSKADMKGYFLLVGTHNQKHLRRYQS